MQRRRIHAEAFNQGVGFTNNLIGEITESNGVNAHGLRLLASIEPEDAGANATGTWALICLPDELTPIPTLSIGALEAEGSNAFIWAVGTWAASNQFPRDLAIEIRTSRNCQNGARLVFQVFNGGVTAGLVSVDLLMTYFTKSL